VNTTPEPDTDPLALGRRIIDILQSGKKTSTYKLAVLQALIDCSMERVPDDPHASVDVPLDELTHRVIDLYWPQTRPLAWNENRPLRQASEGSAILNAVGDLRIAAKAGPNRLLADAKSDAPDAYDNTFKRVKRTLVRYPLRLLQNVPGSSDTFLYNDEWIQKNPTLAEIDKPGKAIQLCPGVAYAMAKLSGLLKPALKWLWADKVWKSNPQLFQGGLDVQQYLFEDRIPLTRIAPALKKKFGPKCFYCNATAPKVTTFHIDHVLPLSVTKLNGLANLVLACPPCNSSKSDHLPVIEHVERALGIAASPGMPTREKAVLDEIGCAIKWDAQFPRVCRAARGLYRTVGPGAPTWRAVGLPLEPLPSQLPAWITDPVESSE
jgi:hypothetical protein